MRKHVSSMALFLLLAGTLVLAPEIKPARADGTIYINADGSITPSTTLISTFDNSTYIFNGNINESIIVQRNNITITGSGHTIQGSGSGNGIALESVNSVTVENMDITGFSNGIYLNSSSNNMLLNNQATANYKGIVLNSSSNNTLRDNNVTENPAYGIALCYSSFNNLSANTAFGNAGLGGSGIYLSFSTCNILSRNNATSNWYGLVLDSSSNNILSQNTIDKSLGSNFVIDGSTSNDYINSVDASNLVNGKPICYLVDQDGLLIDSSTHSSVGYLALVNCTNIIVENLTLTNANRQGALIAYTTNSTVRDNNILNGDYGISLYCSSMNIVSENNVTGTGWGIYIHLSINNTVYHNNLIANGVGISLNNDSNNRIYNNNVTGNRGGVSLDSSSYDTVNSNVVTGSTSWGIWVISSSMNVIASNNVTRNSNQGVFLYSSFDDAVSDNDVKGNFGDGICIDYYCCNETVYANSVRENTGRGIVLYSSYNNTIIVNYPVESADKVCRTAYEATSSDEWANSTVMDNNVTGNLSDGIALIRTSGNFVLRNNVLENGYGIVVDNASRNTICLNNFINNNYQAAIPIYGLNVWDGGYPSGGNYWSDYTGTDLYNGVYQNISDSDGIGDAPYMIGTNNADHYPLIDPIESFVIGVWNATAYCIDIVSNSTVSNVLTDLVNRRISFNVTGLEGTHGFCRLTIPNIIIQELWHGNYSILLNNEPWPSTNWTDGSSMYIYFSYTYSESKVMIIPEFPYALATLFFATFLAVALMKKKDVKTRFELV